MSIWVKDPEAVVDFAFDWSTWLASGDTIDTFTVTVPSGITLDSSSEASGVVTAWISGGTAGTTYIVECKIVTTQGRTDERSRPLDVFER